MVELIIILVVVAFALFLMNRFLPIDDNIKQLITYVAYFVIVLLVILFLLKMFGFDVPTPKLN